MVDKALDPGRAGSADRDLSDGHFVGADVGADVVHRPDSSSGLVHSRLDAHVPDEDFLRAQFFDGPNLLGTVYQRPNLRPLGGQRYVVGKAWAKHTVSACFDPERRQFVFTLIRPKTKRGQRQPEPTPVRLDAKKLDEVITGLPAALEDLPMRQLMLPLSMCYPQPIAQGV